VFDGNRTHYYQPGLTNTSGGVWTDKEIQRWLIKDNADLIMKGVKYE
jgi:hypothetical protein